MGNKIVYKKNDEVKEIEFDDLKNIEDVEIVKDDDEDDDWDENSVRGKIVAITPILCTIIYLLLGFYKGLWHPGWVIFLLVPIVPLVIKMFSGSKGCIIGFFSLLITASYIVLGFMFSWWHPGWIIFLLIPIISIIVGGNSDR